MHGKGENWSIILISCFPQNIYKQIYGTLVREHKNYLKEKKKIENEATTHLNILLYKKKRIYSS